MMVSKMSDDEDLFSQLVGDDVTPVKVEPRVALHKNSKDEQSEAARRQAASEIVATPEDPLSGEPAEMVDPLALLSFQRPGVQHGVFKNLRLGKYKLDARLDLHKMGVDRARQEVYQFIRDCIANDIRSALITHGKGEGRDTQALLKSYVAFWLPQIDQVLAFHTAQKRHGSYGATYVLLKKSEQKKLETRNKLIHGQ